MLTRQTINSHLRTSLVVGAAIVFSTIIGSWAFLHVKSGDHTIVVTGSARKRIRSDLIVWRVNISQQSTQLADAYKTLSDNTSKVRGYLVSKGITESQIVSSSIVTKPIHAKGSGPDYEGNQSGPITS